MADGACDAAEPHAHVAEGTTFETNGIDGLEVADDANVALLYDKFISEVLGQDAHMETLDGKARAAVGGAFETSEDVQTEFRYMDLVDTTNGNAWVAPADDSSVTVFLPYTDSMTAESDIAVAYFEGLTRDYTVDLDPDNLSAEVAGTTAHEVQVTKTADGITFEVPYLEFGPFEIMWLNDGEPENPGEGEEGETPETPEQPGDDGDNNGQQRPAGDKNDGPSDGDAIPDTGDAALAAAPALLAGCAAVMAAARLARRRS